MTTPALHKITWLLTCVLVSGLRAGNPTANEPGCPGEQRTSSDGAVTCVSPSEAEKDQPPIESPSLEELLYLAEAIQPESGDDENDVSNAILDELADDVSKRASGHDFMRFGRDPATHQIMRFGKRGDISEDQNHQFMRFGRLPGDQHQIMRFGRAQGAHQIMRFGRGQGDGHKIMRFGRTPSDAHQIMRFGRTPGEGHQIMRFGRSPAEGHHIMRFGRTPQDGHQIMRFGKRNDLPLDDSDNQSQEDSTIYDGIEMEKRTPSDHQIMRFGRTGGHDFMRFGRADKSHQIMRFGRTPSAHEIMRFGRGSPSSHDFMRFGRAGGHDFMRFGRSTSGKQRRAGHDFMRFGRGREQSKEVPVTTTHSSSNLSDKTDKPKQSLNATKAS